MKSLANVFLKGLVFTLPIFITFGLIYWLFATAENMLKVPLQYLLPQGWYITGLGVICAFTLIFIAGLLVQAYVVKFIFNKIENLLGKIPLVKTLYSSAKDLMSFFTNSKDEKMSRVVRVEFADNIHLMGFVTNDGISLGETSDLLAVYFPMSYQIGGYTAYMPKSRCEILDIPVQTAMQQILTANIKR